MTTSLQQLAYSVRHLTVKIPRVEPQEVQDAKRRRVSNKMREVMQRRWADKDDRAKMTELRRQRAAMEKLSKSGNGVSCLPVPGSAV